MSEDVIDKTTISAQSQGIGATKQQEQLLITGDSKSSKNKFIYICVALAIVIGIFLVLNSLKLYQFMKAGFQSSKIENSQRQVE